MSSITAAAPVSVPLEAALELQLEAEVGVLSAALVEELHQRWSVPSNFMFVACPTKDTPVRHFAFHFSNSTHMHVIFFKRCMIPTCFFKNIFDFVLHGLIRLLVFLYS